MAQRLLLPFRRGMIICGYKTDAYRKAWGYPHYGIDISTYQGVMQGDHYIRASGDGTVVKVGNDGSLGKGLCVVYLNCIARDGTVKSLTARYMHMSTVYVKQGQVVKAGDILADEGSVGTKEPHLHFELDTDTRTAYANYSPQVSSANHSFWVKGYDSTVNPSLWLWTQSGVATQEPYYAGWRPEWITAGVDDHLPSVPEADQSARITQLEQLVAEKGARIAELEKKIAAAIAALK